LACARESLFVIIFAIDQMRMLCARVAPTMCSVRRQRPASMPPSASLSLPTTTTSETRQHAHSTSTATWPFSAAQVFSWLGFCAFSLSSRCRCRPSESNVTFIAQQKQKNASYIEQCVLVVRQIDGVVHLAFCTHRRTTYCEEKINLRVSRTTHTTQRTRRCIINIIDGLSDGSR
jgi:hypothetical protein